MIARCRPLLGTYVEIRVREPRHACAFLALEHAFAAVEQVQALMGFHDPASDLSRLNRFAHGHPQHVHPWTHRVLRLAARLRRESAGVFDPAVAPRLVENGLLPRPDGAPEPDRHATMLDVELLEHSRVRFRKPLWLDLGGIAKGFAVDAAVATLRAHGVRTGAVNAGGDLRVFGEESQSVHLRDPAQPARTRPLGALRNGACATSGGYFMEEREGGWATFDPRGGPRRRSGSISVVAPRCAVADALTKIVALAPASLTRVLLRRYRAEALPA
jgi:thiamine biosynthesis lipoprotein